MRSAPIVSPEAQAKIDAWDKRIRWPIIIAALAPFVGVLLPISFESGGFVLAVDLASWAVFAVDLTVRLRYSYKYLRTGTGMLDLAIVVFTFPWYVFPAWGGTYFLSIFRLVRLATVLLSGRSKVRLRYIYGQLGGLGLVSLVVMAVASIIVFRAEPPEAGFDSIGDAFWWSVVTVTTVGYGDFVPETSEGRFAGLMLMLLGLAALGSVAGVLSSMFRGDAEEKLDPSTELAEIKAQLETLNDKLDRLTDRTP